MKTKIRIYSSLLFLIPVLFYLTFDYLDIPKKIFLNTVIFFNHFEVLSFIFFIFFFTISILLFLPLGVFFYIISGVIFNPFLGYLCSLSAILIGTSISFYISQKNFAFIKNKKKRYDHFLKKLRLSNNEFLNILLFRLMFFIPISISNILSIFITKNLIKLLIATIVTTSPSMLAVIISASKIKDQIIFDQFQSIELIKIYSIILSSFLIIYFIRLFINSSIDKSKKASNSNLIKKIFL